MSESEEKKGWSWLGFFFAPYYYAGYGELKKGIIYAVVVTIPLIGGLVVAILGGMNAKKDLPIGKQDFNWGNVAIALVVAVVSGIIIQLAIESATSSQEIKTIKQSNMDMCPTATVEEMVDSFMGDPSWESDTTENGTKFVNVSGDITYADKPVRAVVQFLFSADETSFEYNAFEINGVPQNQFIAAVLLNTMCDSVETVTSTIEDESTNDTAINYSDKPVFIESYEDGIITVLLKGKELYCTVKLTEEDEIITTTCKRLLNHENVKTICTKNNEICKTESQIVNEINQEFANARSAMQEL